MLKETLDMLVMEVLGKFDFNFFKKLAANNIRPRNKEEEEDFAWTQKAHPEIAYAKKMLPEMGQGSSRVVYALSGGKVLKIALNNPGVAQNRAEVDVSTHGKNIPLVAKVYDASPDYKWIVSELVKPFRDRSSEMQAMLGISRDLSPVSFAKIIEKAAKNNPDGLESILDLRNPYMAELWNHIKQNPKAMKFLEDVAAAAKIGNLHPEELVMEHFGLTVDGQIKILDYGGTWEVINDYY